MVVFDPTFLLMRGAGRVLEPEAPLEPDATGVILD